MNISTLAHLADTNFDVLFLNSLYQRWVNTKNFQCIDSPKKYNLLLYVHGCTFTYTDKQGNIYTAHSGDIVYTPEGSEYKAEISDAENPDAYTIGINFFIFDEKRERVTLSESVQIFHSFSDKSIGMLFHRTLEHDVLKPAVRNKILLLEILCSLASHTVKKNIPEKIVNCIHYISEHICENPPVSHLAGMCYMSEVYFRKLFKASVGMTPVQYKNLLRLDRARSLLEYGDISVQEISDMLSYSTVSHFIKEFRSEFGISPLQYRIKFTVQK